VSAPYSAVLAVGTLAAGDADQVVDVPTGKVMIVRDVSAYSNAPIDTSELFIEDTDTGGTFVFLSVNSTEKGSRHWDGRQAFRDSGFTVHAGHGTWDYRITGYLLDA